MLKRAQPTTEVYGIDADLEALEIARNKVAKAGLEVKLDQALASALPYADASFDRVLSSLFFHHLPSELKVEALLDVIRVLRPGGEFDIADWGQPTSRAMRLAFVGVQLLDGFRTTHDSVVGVLPDLLSLTGFEKVEVTRHYSTLLGTLSLYRARKPSPWRGEERRHTH